MPRKRTGFVVVNMYVSHEDYRVLSKEARERGIALTQLLTLRTHQQLTTPVLEESLRRLQDRVEAVEARLASPTP